MIAFSNVNVPGKCDFDPILAEFSLFHDFVSAADPSDRVVLTKSRDVVIMTYPGNRVEIPLRQGAKEYAAKFPKPGKVQPVQVLDFPNAVKKARIVAPKEHNESQILTGIHVKNPKRGTLIAESADGTRYIMTSIPSKGPTIDCTIENSGGSLLSQLPDKGRLLVTERHLFYHCKLGEFAVLLLNGKYPDLRALVTRKNTAQVVLDKPEFARTLQKAGFIGAERIVFEPSAGIMHSYAKRGNRKHKGELAIIETSGEVPRVILDVEQLGPIASLSGKEVLLMYGTARDGVWTEVDNTEYLTMPYVSEEG